MLRIILFIPTLFLSVFIFSQKKIDQKTVEKSTTILTLEMQKTVDALAAQQANDEHQSTATFIATAFKNNHLQPFIDSNNYIQHFQMDQGKKIKLATTLKINGVALEIGSDYWPFAFCPNTFFAGTAVWDGMQPNEPYLYDLKSVIEKNKTATKQELIQHIKEKTNELAAKKITAVIIYNSADVNDNLEFDAADTTSLSPIPVIFFTKAGIKKLKTESTIAVAMDAHIVLGENIINGKNTIAFLNNGSANTVIVAAPVNDVVSTAIMLQLAKLLKETCYPIKKNINKLKAANYNENNYLFTSFDDIDSNYFGNHYFFEHLPLNDVSKINYAIDINVMNLTNDSPNFFNIDGIYTSPAWNAILHGFDPVFNLKINQSINYNLNTTSFYTNNIPVLCFCNSTTDLPVKTAPTINLNGIKTVDYIIQLIGSANNKGKLPFNK